MVRFLLLALAAQLTRASNADSCLAGHCAAATRSMSMLQMRAMQEELEFTEIPNTVERTKYVNGVPVYLKEVDGTPEAEVLLQDGGDDGVREWMLDMPHGETMSGMVALLARFGLTDAWTGELEHVIIVKGTQSQITSFLKDQKLPTGAFMEQSSELHALPVPTGVDIDQGEESDDIVDATQKVPWGLDRIDDVDGLDQDYSDFSAKQGAGAHVYVLDTGIRTTHRDFGGRAFAAYDEFSNPKVCDASSTCARDGHGHGTHCAGTVGGSKYGVAKKASLHAVKVLSDTGSGSTSGIVRAMEWISANGKKPAVMSMSLGGRGNSPTMKRAVDTAKNAGIPVIVAAGNSNTDACLFSPAYVPAAITVGSTDNLDRRSSFSNYGKCIDIFAPGTRIMSAGHRDDTGSRSMSGTSMACPHVAGASALILGENPRATVEQVTNTLLYMGKNGKVKKIPSAFFGPTPNKFLNVQPLPSGPTSTTTTTTTTTTTGGPDSLACDFEPGFCLWTDPSASRTSAWRIGSRTPSRGTGPQKGDHSDPGSKFAYVEASSPNYPNKKFILISPRFNGSTSFLFEFWYNMYGSGMGTIVLESSDGQSWSRLWSKKGNLGDKWRLASVQIPAGMIQLRFSARTGRSWASDFALDDLSAKATQVGLLSGGLTATGSSDSGWGRYSALTDGSLSNRWHANNNDYPSWLSIDLGNSATISSMRITTAPDSLNYGFKKLTTQRRSEENGDWSLVRIETFTASSCSPNRATMHEGWPESTRYVKITLEDRCAGNDFALAEWEIFGSPQTTTTTTQACSEFYKAAGNSNCPDGDAITLEAMCQTAAPCVGRSFVSSGTNNPSRPAGCYWEGTASASYFNKDLAGVPPGSWAGGICRQQPTTTSQTTTSTSTLTPTSTLTATSTPTVTMSTSTKPSPTPSTTPSTTTATATTTTTTTTTTITTTTTKTTTTTATTTTTTTTTTITTAGDLIIPITVNASESHSFIVKVNITH